jgi:hypothetical protein
MSAGKDILSQTDTEFGTAAQSQRRKVNMAIVKITVLLWAPAEDRSSSLPAPIDKSSPLNSCGLLQNTC